MLKLEKAPNSSGLAIRMRERERLFEPRLLKALAIALILHCGALLLFQVTPFHLSSTFTFPPVKVQADAPIQSVSALVISSIEEEVLMPPPLRLLPTLDWISLNQESTLVPSVVFNPHALESLEERIWPKWEEEPLALKLEEPRIQLTIAGDLAELPLVTTDPLLNEMIPIALSGSPISVAYQVQLDEKTGEIFWYERIESSAMTTIDQLTEKILLNLRFTPPDNHEPVTGILIFVVSIL